MLCNSQHINVIHVSYDVYAFGVTANSSAAGSKCKRCARAIGRIWSCNSLVLLGLFMSMASPLGPRGQEADSGTAWREAGKPTHVRRGGDFVSRGGK